MTYKHTCTRTVAMIAILTSLMMATTPTQAASAGARAVPHTVVNVNTATVEQLQYLPGVGPMIAQRIIAGRQYAKPEDLDKVKGIGPVKLARILPYVTVTGPTTAKAKIKLPETIEY